MGRGCYSIFTDLAAKTRSIATPPPQVGIIYNGDMNPQSPAIPSRPPLTDSPWFWVCLFATAALLGLWLAGGKYGARQSQIERQYQARQLHGQSVKPAGEREELSTADDTLITLGPLYAIVGVSLAASWLVMLWTHFRAGPETQLDEQAGAEQAGAEQPAAPLESPR